MRIDQSKSATIESDFRNGMVKRVKLRQRAKFHGDRSNHSRDMAVPNFVDIGQTAAEIWRFFYFSRWRPPPSIRQKSLYLATHLGFVMCVCSDYPRMAFCGLYRCAKFGWIDAVVFREHVRYMLSPVRLSSVCLSVTLVHPTQTVQIFGNIFYGIRYLGHMKISRRSSQGNPSVGGVKHKRGSQV